MCELFYIGVSYNLGNSRNIQCDGTVHIYGGDRDAGGALKTILNDGCDRIVSVDH